MKLLALILSFYAQQLTWYEIYEEGERLYKKGNYAACIEKMDEVLALRPEPKLNQFTRAVQKIDYKPFYYKALSYSKSGDVIRSFKLAQKAFQAEVVKGSPKLQADLAQILDEYRQWVLDLHDRFSREQQLVAERTELLNLLSQERLDEAETRLQRVDTEGEFTDIRLNLELRKQHRLRLEKVRLEVAERLAELLLRPDRLGAASLLDSTRSMLPPDEVLQWERRIQALPSAESTSPDSGENTEKPVPDLVGPMVAREEIDFFKTQVEDLKAQGSQMSDRLRQIKEKNRLLEDQLLEANSQEVKVSWPPKLFLNLASLGGALLQIRAKAFSPLLIQSWQVELNGVSLELPKTALRRNGPDFNLEHQLRVPLYGPQRVLFVVTDELGNQYRAQDLLDMPLPWYLRRRYWAAGGLVLAAFLVLFLARSLNRKKTARLRNFNPYIAGSPVRLKHMFFGRDELLRRIEGLVHKNSFMIHGDRRIGKTSLLLQLKRRLQRQDSPQYRFFPVFVDLQGVREEDLFHHMMAEVLAEAELWPVSLSALSFQEENRGYLSRHFSRDMKALIAMLAQSENKHVLVVLLVDEVDVLNEFSEKTNQKLRGIFMKEYAEHLTCVMAGIHLKKEWESSGSPWYNFFEEIPVTTFDQEAARQLVLGPVKGIFKFNVDAVERITNAGGGHPYLIQKICVSLIGEKLKANHFRVRLADVEMILARFDEEAKRNRLP